jgi:hypothetical protein
LLVEVEPAPFLLVDEGAVAGERAVGVVLITPLHVAADLDAAVLEGVASLAVVKEVGKSPRLGGGLFGRLLFLAGVFVGRGGLGRRRLVGRRRGRLIVEDAQGVG